MLTRTCFALEWSRRRVDRCNASYQGYDVDTTRFAHPTNYRGPFRDRPGYMNINVFGSAHPSGAQFVMCDGSVHRISFSVQPDVHSKLANRKDGQAVDVGSL